MEGFEIRLTSSLKKKLSGSRSHTPRLTSSQLDFFFTFGILVHRCAQFLLTSPHNELKNGKLHSRQFRLKGPRVLLARPPEVVAELFQGVEKPQTVIRTLSGLLLNTVRTSTFS